MSASSAGSGAPYPVRGGRTASARDRGVRASQTDDVSLCASELVANALPHGVPPGRGFLPGLLPCADGVRVEVHESGGGMPAVPGHRPDGNGRGLLPVAGPADGREVREREPGEVVWCAFALTAVPSRGAAGQFAPALTAFPPTRWRVLQRRANGTTGPQGPPGPGSRRRRPRAGRRRTVDHRPFRPRGSRRLGPPRTPVVPRTGRPAAVVRTRRFRTARASCRARRMPIPFVFLSMV